MSAVMNRAPDDDCVVFRQPRPWFPDPDGTGLRRVPLGAEPLSYLFRNQAGLSFDRRVQDENSRHGDSATVIKGKGIMPPRAGSPSLSDADIKAAVDYMIQQVK